MKSDTVNDTVNDTVSDTVNGTVNNTTNVGVNVGVKLNKTQTSILKEIDKKPEITIDELSKLISVETRTIERNIRQLKEKNLLERKGSDKNGEWVIKK